MNIKQGPTVTCVALPAARKVCMHVCMCVFVYVCVCVCGISQSFLLFIELHTSTHAHTDTHKYTRTHKKYAHTRTHSTCTATLVGSSSRATAIDHSSSSRGGSGAAAIPVFCFALQRWNGVCSL